MNSASASQELVKENILDLESLTKNLVEPEKYGSYSNIDLLKKICSSLRNRLRKNNEIILKYLDRNARHFIAEDEIDVVFTIKNGECFIESNPKDSKDPFFSLVHSFKSYFEFGFFYTTGSHNFVGVTPPLPSSQVATSITDISTLIPVPDSYLTFLPSSLDIENLKTIVAFKKSNYQEEDMEMFRGMVEAFRQKFYSRAVEIKCKAGNTLLFGKFQIEFIFEFVCQVMDTLEQYSRTENANILEEVSTTCFEILNKVRYEEIVGVLSYKQGFRLVQSVNDLVMGLGCKPSVELRQCCARLHYVAIKIANTLYKEENKNCDFYRIEDPTEAFLTSKPYKFLLPQKTEALSHKKSAGEDLVKIFNRGDCSTCNKPFEVDNYYMMACGHTYCKECSNWCRWQGRT